MKLKFFSFCFSRNNKREGGTFWWDFWNGLDRNMSVGDACLVFFPLPGSELEFKFDFSEFFLEVIMCRHVDPLRHHARVPSPRLQTLFLLKPFNKTKGGIEICGAVWERGVDTEVALNKRNTTKKVDFKCFFFFLILEDLKGKGKKKKLFCVTGWFFCPPNWETVLSLLTPSKYGIWKYNKIGY